MPPPVIPRWHALWLPALLLALALTATVLMRRRSVERIEMPEDPKAFKLTDDGGF